MASSVEPKETHNGRLVGRYVLYDEIAAGGMATVHIGRLMGPAGFSRTVAIKRLHPHLAKDRDFAAMLLDEARLVVRVRHPNVVSVLDVVQDTGELLLVMDYVQGESVSALIRAARANKEHIPFRITRSIIVGALHGLHAAHESTDERGEPLGIVHRDVSPQNVMVGVDGVVRVLDFGIAKAAGRLQTTRDGEIKGKTSYMSPEQLRGTAVDRRTDVYASAVMLWEMLVGERLFAADSPAATMNRVLEQPIDPPSKKNPLVTKGLDDVVMKGLSRDPRKRFSTAREMAIAVEDLGDFASARETGEWVEKNASAPLRERAQRIAEIESSSFMRMSLSALAAASPAADGAPKPVSDDATVVERPRATIPPPTEPTALFPAAPASYPSAPSAAPHAEHSSSISAVARADDAPRARPKRIAALAALAVLVPLAAVVVRGALRAHAVTPAANATTATNGATTSIEPAAPEPAAPSSSGERGGRAPDEPPARDAPTVPPVPPAAGADHAGRGPDAPPAPSAPRHPPRRGTPPAAAPPAPPPAPPAPPARASCDPPYTIDARGIRIPKPECL